MDHQNYPSHEHVSKAADQERKYWSWEENKLFEHALVDVDHRSPHVFELIALRVPGKTTLQIKQHFNALIEDIGAIESGVVPLPNYRTINQAQIKSSSSSRPSRKRGAPWTPKEHKLFLEGLEKYGKGDWRSISRKCVVTRTPTQVASHAQKYFIRINNTNNKPHHLHSSSTT